VDPGHELPGARRPQRLLGVGALVGRRLGERDAERADDGEATPTDLMGVQLDPRSAGESVQAEPVAASA
jgi:hypothetical protein